MRVEVRREGGWVGDDCEGSEIAYASYYKGAERANTAYGMCFDL